MAKIQTINPETASHNIASAFIGEYIKSIAKPKMFSLDGTDVYSVPKNAAQLYAIVYDEAYEYFSSENNKD